MSLVKRVEVLILGLHDGLVGIQWKAAMINFGSNFDPCIYNLLFIDPFHKTKMRFDSCLQKPDYMTYFAASFACIFTEVFLAQLPTQALLQQLIWENFSPGNWTARFSQARSPLSEFAQFGMKSEFCSQRKFGNKQRTLSTKPPWHLRFK